jgi:hypothetical protein
MNSNAMTVNSYSKNKYLKWNYFIPDLLISPLLIIFLSDWSYGLLPYCGPGSREEVWRRERIFQEKICNFFNESGIATLWLETDKDDSIIPLDEEFIDLSNAHIINQVINKIISESGLKINQTLLFGHGFGSRIICDLTYSGINPAGYIIAGGVYSDIISVLAHKYLTLKESLTSQKIKAAYIPDKDTHLIIDNLGKILHFSKKGKNKIRLKDSQHSLDFYLPKELFFDQESFSNLYSILNAPTLIIHGSGDLDIPVGNAFFLETKLKQRISSVSRLIMLDLDHWFREMPKSSEDRIIERMLGICNNNSIDPRFLKNCLVFIEDILSVGKSKKQIKN